MTNQEIIKRIELEAENINDVMFNRYNDDNIASKKTIEFLERARAISINEEITKFINNLINAYNEELLEI